MLLAQPHVVECLVDNRRGTHRQHSTEENAVHLRPSEKFSDEDAEQHHRKHDATRRNDGRHAHFQDFLERKIESEREQKEENTDVGPRMDIFLIDHRCQIRHVGRHEKSSHDVAQHKRLLEPFENERHGSGHDEDEREVENQCFHSVNRDSVRSVRRCAR